MAARDARAAGSNPVHLVRESGGLGFDLGHVGRRGAVNSDPARFLRLGDFALQVNEKQPVLEARTSDLDVVGKRERALEIASRDTAMQEGPLFLVALAALERQDVLLDGELDLIGLEPG